MRFYKPMKPKKLRRVFLWWPTKIFGQYESGYGQMGTVWLEWVWKQTKEDGSTYYEL